MSQTPANTITERWAAPVAAPAADEREALVRRYAPAARAYAAALGIDPVAPSTAAVAGAARADHGDRDTAALHAVRDSAMERLAPAETGRRRGLLRRRASAPLCASVPILLLGRASGRLSEAEELSLAEHLRNCDTCAGAQNRLAAAEQAFADSLATAPAADSPAAWSLPVPVTGPTRETAGSPNEWGTSAVAEPAAPPEPVAVGEWKPSGPAQAELALAELPVLPESDLPPRVRAAGAWGLRFALPALVIVVAAGAALGAAGVFRSSHHQAKPQSASVPSAAAREAAAARQAAEARRLAATRAAAQRRHAAALRRAERARARRRAAARRRRAAARVVAPAAPRVSAPSAPVAAPRPVPAPRTPTTPKTPPSEPTSPAPASGVQPSAPSGESGRQPPPGG